MTITLFHHSYSRASSVVAMLEAVGCAYDLHPIDIMSGEQKSSVIVDKNPMGKLPVLVDDDVVMTEAAAIGLYLADRYALGRLAPAFDDPRRGPYLRWSLFAPSVIEPAALAAQSKWDVNASTAGWGAAEDMLKTVEHVVTAADPWILGEMFSMADIIFGGTVRYMLGVGGMPATPALSAYADRLGEHPAIVAAEAINTKALPEPPPGAEQ